MNMAALSQHWLGIIGTLLIIVSYIPQIKHLLQSRCSDGISLSAYFLWFLASVLLSIYAFIVKEPVFFALQGYHAFACGLVLLLSIKFISNRQCGSSR